MDADKIGAASRFDLAADRVELRIDNPATRSAAWNGLKVEDLK